MRILGWLLVRSGATAFTSFRSAGEMTIPLAPGMRAGELRACSVQGDDESVEESLSAERSPVLLCPAGKHGSRFQRRARAICNRRMKNGDPGSGVNKSPGRDTST
jgi:hypothetical protein